MTLPARDNGGLEVAQTVTAEEAVTATLRAAIRDGALTPGQRLTQSEIAAQLGVSRIPLRDALRRLEVESLVEIDGHRGARVTVLSEADVAEIYEMRIMLEARCMRYAIENLSAEAAMALADEATGSEREDLSPREAFQLRREFYGRLYAYSERPRMRRTIMQLRDNVDRYHMLSDRSHAHLAHKELAEAIAERNADRAVAVLTEHISDSRDDLIAALAAETIDPLG